MKTCVLKFVSFYISVKNNNGTCLKLVKNRIQIYFLYYYKLIGDRGDTFHYFNENQFISQFFPPDSTACNNMTCYLCNSGIPSLKYYLKIILYSSKKKNNSNGAHCLRQRGTLCQGGSWATKYNLLYVKHQLNFSLYLISQE